MDLEFFMEEIKIMPVGIYQDGNSDSCRVYFGGIPRLMTAKWKLYSEGDVGKKKEPKEFGNFLLESNGLKADNYVDGSIPARFGVQVKMDAKTLSMIIEKTFGISMTEKSL